MTCRGGWLVATLPQPGANDLWQPTVAGGVKLRRRAVACSVDEEWRAVCTCAYDGLAEARGVRCGSSGLEELRTRQVPHLNVTASPLARDWSATAHSAALQENTMRSLRYSPLRASRSSWSLPPPEPAANSTSAA